MGLLIATDSFKGTYTAEEVAKKLQTGLTDKLALEAKLFPISDGGEGFSTILAFHHQAERQEAMVQNAYGDPQMAAYYYRPDTKTAYLEVAAASGLDAQKAEAGKGFDASSYGTGQLLLHAIGQGAKTLVLGLGGSATNDGGMGLAMAMGTQVTNANGKALDKASAKALSQVQDLDPSSFLHRFGDLCFVLCCDVEHKLLGEQGATHAFGPQKGLSKEALNATEKAMAKWAALWQSHTNTDLKNTKRLGAAGGLALPFMALPHSQLLGGFDYLAEQTPLRERLAAAKLLVTGEGKMDQQSLAGKAPIALARLAKAANKLVLAFNGQCTLTQAELSRAGIAASINLADHENDWEKACTALARTAKALLDE